MQSLWGCAYEIRSLGQGGETGIGKMAAEKVFVPPAGREAKGGTLNRPRRQMSFLSFSDSCELAGLRTSIHLVCFVLGYAKDAWQCHQILFTL
jgi:hypothetical protein